MSMEVKSVDSKYTAEIELRPYGCWDDGDYVKGFKFSASFQGLNFSSQYSGEGGLRAAKEDELLSFISELESLYKNLSGSAFYEFFLSGEIEPDGELTFYKVKLGFYSLDALGNIAFKIICQREHRYSNTKDFIHESAVEFQVHQACLEAFIMYLKTKYTESNIKNENY